MMLGSFQNTRTDHIICRLVSSGLCFFSPSGFFFFFFRFFWFHINTAVGRAATCLAVPVTDCSWLWVTDKPSSGYYSSGTDKKKKNNNKRVQLWRIPSHTHTHILYYQAAHQIILFSGSGPFRRVFYILRCTTFTDLSDCSQFYYFFNFRVFVCLSRDFALTLIFHLSVSPLASGHHSRFKLVPFFQHIFFSGRHLPSCVGAVICITHPSSAALHSFCLMSQV